MNYLVYFLGPVVLAIVGANALRQRYRLVVVGMAAFVLSWSVWQAGVAGAAAALPPLPPLAFAAVSALIAALCTEVVRYLALRRACAAASERTWRASLTFALGHHGMAMITAGATLLLLTFVLRHRPEAFTNPLTIASVRANEALSAGERLLLATETLAVGLLVQACFSGIVMLAVARLAWRWLWLAIVWHATHDFVAFGVNRLATQWIVGRAWALVIIIGYSYLAVRIYRALQPGPPSPSGTSVGPSPMILPGRTV